MTEGMELWLKTLESDEYEQGCGTLKHDNQFCCLGVACDLYAKHAPNPEWHWVGNVFTSDSGVRETNVLTQQVMDWLGIKSTDPLVFLPDSQPSAEPNVGRKLRVSSMNDTYGKSFKVIAAQLRKGSTMSTPSEKSPQIDNLLTSIAGISRKDAAEQSICTICKGPAKVFRDLLSARENAISGLCQKCQDETFGGKE